MAATTLAQDPNRELGKIKEQELEGVRERISELKQSMDEAAAVRVMLEQPAIIKRPLLDLSLTRGGAGLAFDKDNHLYYLQMFNSQIQKLEPEKKPLPQQVLWRLRKKG